MTYHKHESILHQLRALVPERTLHYGEARRIAELQATRLRELVGAREPELLEEAISKLPRLTVERAVDLPVSGVAQWHNGRWIVALNALEPDTRQRFSLAHELFHIVNHTTKQWLHPDTPRFSSYATGERLADHFAACLLMPRRHVRTLVAHGLHLGELADVFDVSTRAMEVRLNQLRIGIRSTTGRTRPPTTYYRRSTDCTLWCEGAAA